VHQLGIQGVSDTPLFRLTEGVRMQVAPALGLRLVLLDGYAFRQFVSELGIVGRVGNVSEKTGIFEAHFEYAGESRISLSVTDQCVIHPMFYRKLNIRMTKPLYVYPFPDHEEFKFEVSQAL